MPPRSLALLLSLLIASAGAPGEATAAEVGPVVRVRARSALQLAEAEREVLSGGKLALLRLRVVLRDAVSGEALDGQVVRVRVEALPGERLVRTDADGQGTLPLPPLRPGRHVVSARFAGDALRDPAEASLQLDLSRRGARLALSAPARIPLGAELPVTVDLHDGDAPLPGPVALRVGAARSLLPLRDGRGAWAVRVDAGVSARGGALLPVEAEFPGDDFYDRVRDRRDVLVMTQARVELARLGSGGGEAAQGSSLTATGAAHDEEGPLVGEPVQLLWLDGSEGGPGRLLASGLTDGAGRFSLTVPRLALPLGPALLQVAVRPSRAHRVGARSEALRLVVLPPEPVSLVYFLAPLAATALVLLCALLAHRRRWLLSLLRRRLRRAPPEEDVPEPGEGPRPGVTMPSRSRVQAVLGLGRPDFTVAGQVRDAAFGGPVRAEVVAGGAAPERCDGAGRFSLALLPQGRHEIEVCAPGYLPQRFVAELPHRGELRGVQVALLPVRAQIMALWRAVAEPLLPTLATPSTWTPRELLADVRARAAQVPLPSLVRLTDLVEEAYYSGRPAALATLSEVEALCAEVAESVPAFAAPAKGQRPPGGAAPLAPLG